MYPIAKSISVGNEELDRQFGGGIPSPSMILIEGEHGTGKSAITAQIMKGLLDANQTILCIVENNASQYIEKMKSITFNFTKPFVRDRLSFIPIYIKDAKWTESNSKQILPELKKYITEKIKKYDCIVIDSIAPIVIYSDNQTVLEFISFCKQLVGKGKTVLISFHSSDLPKSISTAMIGAGDVYFKLGTAAIGDREVKTLRTIKLLGATDSPESGFAFDVDMIFGIKIVPVSMANA